ncbi:MAG: tetratricopeptide repeat protein [Burkholderiales bacterium]|nr:tetratricopeptide repeat protein [Burkholderiales bacterium]
MDVKYEQAQAMFLLGVGHYQAGRYAEAEQQFAGALALVPGRPSALTNLGAARLKLGRTNEALQALDLALVQEPDNAEALAHRATALAELGRHLQALAAFDRSLAINPVQPAAWSMRGNVLRELGRLDDAAASFEKAIEQGADREMNQYFLAALRGGATPPAAPRDYVRALFDNYAQDFGDHLVRELRYESPQVLVQRLSRRDARGLDLGCGSGLCGPLLKPLVQGLDGVDLSPAILEKARELGVYDTLAEGEIVEFLAATPHRYGTVVAADVLVYLGDLAPVFQGVRHVLEPGGRFAFTVEDSLGAGDIVLRPSLRYAHAESYVRRMAQAHGFEVAHIEQRPLREDQGRPVMGLAVWLARAN